MTGWGLVGKVSWKVFKGLGVNEGSEALGKMMTCSGPEDGGGWRFCGPLGFASMFAPGLHYFEWRTAWGSVLWDKGRRVKNLG